MPIRKHDYIAMHVHVCICGVGARRVLMSHTKCHMDAAQMYASRNECYQVGSDGCWPNRMLLETGWCQVASDG